MGTIIAGAIAGLIVPLIIIICIIIVCTGSIYIVAQQNVAIIERLGKFARTESAGLHIKIPFIERIAARVDLRTCQEEFKIDAKTQDNVTVTMTIAAQYRVSAAPGPDPSMSGVYRAYYMLQNPVAQMKSYLIDALRSSVPQYTLDEVFDKKDAIARDVNQTVSGLMVAYGYDVVSTLITSIDLPRDVEASMNSINSAQREKVAAQSLAEAERIKVVTEAKAKAEAMEQAGIGIANQRKAIAEGISTSLNTIKASGVSEEEANQLFMYTQWVDMMTEFAKNSKQSTVVLPADFKESASTFEQMLTANKVSDADNHTPQK
jgi:regulator of protease activity HflC (stomatin/prohibitin superfamily)